MVYGLLNHGGGKGGLKDERGGEYLLSTVGEGGEGSRKRMKVREYILNLSYVTQLNKVQECHKCL